MAARPRNAKGRFVKQSRALVTRRAVVRAAPTYVMAPRRRAAPRRRGVMAGVPWKDIAIVAGIGYLGGRWLRGPAGVKAVAAAKKPTPEGPLQMGTGAPLIVGGLAAAYLHPSLRGAGHLLAGAGAVLVGLRMASRDDNGKVRATEIAGPDLSALAATTAGTDDDEVGADDDDE